MERGGPRGPRDGHAPYAPILLVQQTLTPPFLIVRRSVDARRCINSARSRLWSTLMFSDGRSHASAARCIKLQFANN